MVRLLTGLFRTNYSPIDSFRYRELVDFFHLQTGQRARPMAKVGRMELRRIVTSERPMA
jgi:hypothetical protein